jgi:hypothetical protein
MPRTFVVAIVAALASASCGEVARTGRAPVLLVINSIEAANGSDPGQFFSFLLSDVQTLVEITEGGETFRVPTYFNDPGRATFRIALKNPGTVTAPLGPSTLNEVILSSYRVVFRRTDGRNREGVDVPYAFSGAMSAAVPANGTVTAGFDLVRHQAKNEPPLTNLVAGGGAIFIDTIAEITFYGRDLAGNEIQAAGQITVRFGDFGDE